MAHGDHYKQSGKPIEAKKTFFRIMTYLAKDKNLLIVIGSLIIISIGCNLVGSYMIRPIINNYIIPGNYEGLLHILIILGVIYLIGVAAVYIQYRLLNRIG